MWKIALILVLAFLLRAPFFSEPLDYDEGTYAFFAFFSKGENFYSSLPLLKLPGIIFTYRFLDESFPGEIEAFRIAAAILIVVATFGIYKLGKLLYDQRVGIISALIFALFSSQISLESPANTDFFMMPFMVLSVLFFRLFQKSKNSFWLVLSGLSSGIAVFYKQVAVFEAFFLVFWLVLANLERKRIKIKPLVKQGLIFGSPFFLPLFAALLFFFSRGELTDFRRQSFGSGGEYFLNAWLSGGLFNRLLVTIKVIWSSFWPFWLLTFGGLIIAVKNRKKENIFLFYWLIFALMGASFNGWFFPHYFIQVIPAISLLGGLFMVQALTWKKVAKSFQLFILSFLFLLMIKNQLPDLWSYSQMLQGKISRFEYFKSLGLDTGEAGWFPFYESTDYLKTQMKAEDSVFVWSTTPLPYYLLKKYPTTSFVDNSSLLDPRFMLPTYGGWKFDFAANRQKLIQELSGKTPTYILLHVNPEQIFEQMLLFKDFSSLVNRNYVFEKKFGNILIFKLKEKKEVTRITETAPPETPLELVRRFSAITEVATKNGNTEITFEPMVNPDGILRSFQATYPEVIKINFEETSAQFLGPDGSDFVGNATEKPSGVTDLHIRVKGQPKPVNFVRVKMGENQWNNQQYGVNSLLKVTQDGEVFDLYFEQPSKWEGKTFNIYFIYKDGSLAKKEVKGN